MNKLVDSSARHIHKLRINLLDACNLRCLYCMPEDTKFSSSSNHLTSSQIYNIVHNLKSFGIDEVRLTGGEPLLRSDLYDIVSKLSLLKLKKLCLTTNGIGLRKHLNYFKEKNLNYLNISLDSLEENTYTYITKRNRCHEVTDNILLANEMDFKVKVNCVVMRNYNYSQIHDFIDFSLKNNIEVRFLEMMKIGFAQSHFENNFVPAGEMIEQIESFGYELSKKEMPTDSTSFNFQVNNQASIGFIASESRPFCGGCSRLRISSDGTLRPCMMVAEGPNLSNLSPSEYPSILAHLIEQKPNGRLEKIDRNMNEIGG